MNRIVERLKKEFTGYPDLIIKELKINAVSKVYVIYIETVSSSDKVNNYILKNLIIAITKKRISTKNIKSFIAGPNEKTITKYDEISFYLINGFTVLVTNKEIFAYETRADINRAVEKSSVESSINGPKDSFTENIQINIGLIKRRIKSSSLKIEEHFVGRRTNTMINILYFDDIVNKDDIISLNEKIKKIDIDGIIDSSSLAFLLDGENTSVYPTAMQTERPDVVASSLLEGKIAIVVDTSPYVLIIPSFFSDFVNPFIDNYNKSTNVTFIKMLRLITFFISMIAPALYIAIMNYNQETIPTSLLINFAIQRDGVPFPTIIETILMLLICEMLRESDLRFPSNYGSAISILGAIVLGEASVNAGIVSPITIIVVAITFISSLTFTNTETNNALRYFRFIFILAAGFFGLYGITLGILYFLVYTTNVKSFNKPYYAPIAPFDKIYFYNTIIKTPLKNNSFRSSLLSSKSKIKQKEKL